MVTVLAVCQGVVQRVSGTLRCTVLNLRGSEVLADILCLRNGSHLERSSLEGITRIFRNQLLESAARAPSSDTTQEIAGDEVVHIAGPKCRCFGILSHRLGLALILITDLTAEPRAAREQLRQAILELGPILERKRIDSA